MSATKITAFPEQQELFNRVVSICYEYEGKVSLAAALGVLDLVRDELKLGEADDCNQQCGG